MRLLLLFYVVLYQAFFARAFENVEASPEEIARREPDGDHILQEESQASRVLLPPDGEVTAAAVRRAEERRYPNKRPDKFRELMEETDIHEIRRIIVPPIQENIIDKDDLKHKIDVTISNAGSHGTQIPTVNTLQNKGNENSSHQPADGKVSQTFDPTDLTRTTQKEIAMDTVIESQLPMSRKINFETKNEKIDIESRNKVASLHTTSEQATQSTPKGTLSTDTPRDVSHVPATVTKIVNNPGKMVMNATENEQEKQVTITTTQILESTYPSNTEPTIFVTDKIFSFDNQPIVVPDIHDLTIKKPSIELEAPHIEVRKPSIELEAPLQDSEVIKYETLEKSEHLLTTAETTTILTSPVIIKETENQKPEREITTVTKIEKNAIENVDVQQKKELHALQAYNSTIVDRDLIQKEKATHMPLPNNHQSAQTEISNKQEFTTNYISETTPSLLVETTADNTILPPDAHLLERNFSPSLIRLPSLELELPKLENSTHLHQEPHPDILNGTQSNYAPITNDNKQTPVTETSKVHSTTSVLENNGESTVITEQNVAEKKHSETEEKSFLTFLPIDTIKMKLQNTVDTLRNTIKNESYSKIFEYSRPTQKEKTQNPIRDETLAISNNKQNIDNTHARLPINEKKTQSANTFNPPTQNKNGLSQQTTTFEERQPLLGNDYHTNVFYKDNTNSPNNEKERKEALEFIKDHPLCEQALKYMELTRPQLLFQIYISMAPYYDGITKALNNQPGYAQSYSNYYPNNPKKDSLFTKSTSFDPLDSRELEVGKIIPQESLRINEKFRTQNGGSNNQDLRLERSRNPDSQGDPSAVHIAEALYRRHNGFEHNVKNEKERR